MCDSRDRYAITRDGVYLAYQAVGEGPVDLVWQFDVFGDADLMWETPFGDLLRELASFSRLILHDRRGTGLSSRDVPPPNLETRVADLCVVLDEVGSKRPVLGGELDGGAPNVLFAASQPNRVQSLVWWEPAPRNAWAPDFPWGSERDYIERSAKITADLWGSDQFGAAFAELEASVGNEIPAEFAAFAGRLSRHTATPDVAVMLDRIWNETDVRAILPSVTAPTLLLASSLSKEAADHMASLIPNAEVRTVPATYAEAQQAAIGHIREWVGAAPPAPDLDRVLAAVLFTDIVGSTQRLTELGDAGWRSVLARHNERARAEIDRHRGRYVDSLGDGLFATFDGPARAVRCAQSIGAAVHDLGIQIRSGVHTGEVELDGDAVRGIAVHIGARIAALAAPSEVLVSQTVRDLVAGSGLEFVDRGEHQLKGVPGDWRLYAVASG